MSPPRRIRRLPPPQSLAAGSGGNSSQSSSGNGDNSSGSTSNTAASTTNGSSSQTQPSGNSNGANSSSGANAGNGRRRHAAAGHHRVRLFVQRHQFISREYEWRQIIDVEPRLLPHKLRTQQPTAHKFRPIFQQALNQTVAAPDDTTDQASTTIITAHGDGLGATGSPDGTGQASQTTAATKTATGEVPTVWFAMANFAATATQSVAAASATNATTPTVSMSGLPVAIASRAQAGSSQFDIRLDPPELGHIEVQLNVDSSGQMTSHITADRRDTLNCRTSSRSSSRRLNRQG
ncbi:MAG: flagellar hook-length control protein FliK [Xanthobacteraceae bacterium]